MPTVGDWDCEGVSKSPGTYFPLFLGYAFLNSPLKYSALLIDTNRQMTLQ